VAYPFDMLSHCGIGWAHFGGRDWASAVVEPDPGAQPDARGITHYTGYTPGFMTLVDQNTVRFEALGAVGEVLVEMHPVNAPAPACS
jgi:hypothetical protein